MTTRTGSRRRRVGAAFILTGLLCGTGALAAFQATPASAVEFGSFDLRAGARGTTIFNDDASGARQFEGTAPETEATLQNGPVGNGLAAVAWPGPLAGNAGTLLLVLQPGCTATSPVGLASGSTPVCPLPDDAKQINVPVRAEARSGDNPPTKTFTGVPGTELTATAEAAKVTADATINKSASQPGTFGPTSAHSLVSQTADAAIAQGNSTVQDIDLGGVIKIDSVTSLAKATTDGTKADGSAATAVNGMTVAGQPAYVDDKGFHIGEQGQDTNAVANQIAQQALGQGGFNIYVSTPQKEISGAAAKVTAGSLIITQKSDSGVTGYIFGGSQASVTAAPGSGDLLSGLGGDEFSGGTDGVGSGSLSDVGGVSPSGPSSGAPGGNGPVAIGPIKNASSGGKPVRPGAVVLGALAAVFLAVGMRRLSDDVLTERAAATSCSLEADR
jgi:hypothetical protein